MGFINQTPVCAVLQMCPTYMATAPQAGNYTFLNTTCGLTNSGFLWVQRLVFTQLKTQPTHEPGGLR
jgi:hypothetical protein